MVHALVKVCSLDKEAKDQVRLIYKYIQIGYVILVLVFIACGIAVPVLILQGQALLIVPVFGAAVIIAGLFYCLTVKVTDAYLHFLFWYRLDTTSIFSCRY